MLSEYALASLIYYAMKEGACSEQSARMTAMENSTKNAGWHFFIHVQEKKNAISRSTTLLIFSCKFAHMPARTCYSALQEKSSCMAKHRLKVRELFLGQLSDLFLW